MDINGKITELNNIKLNQKFIEKKQAQISLLSDLKKRQEHEDAYDRETFIEKEVDASRALILSTLKKWSKAPNLSETAKDEIKKMTDAAKVIYATSEVNRIATKSAAAHLKMHESTANAIGLELERWKHLYQEEHIKAEKALKRVKSLSETIKVMKAEIEHYERETGN